MVVSYPNFVELNIVCHQRNVVKIMNIFYEFYHRPLLGYKDQDSDLSVLVAEFNSQSKEIDSEAEIMQKEYVHFSLDKIMKWNGTLPENQFWDYLIDTPLVVESTFLRCGMNGDYDIRNRLSDNHFLPEVDLGA